ncbi:MAG: hypothetical protein AB8G15_13830 [Saprospiraceae bacterium]
MKSIFQLFMITLFCISQYPTKSFAQESSPEIFNIYIGAFVKAKQDDFKSLKDLGYVYARQMDNGLMKIYVGAFDRRSDATKALEKVKMIGFSDAYLSKRALADGKQVPVIQLGLSQVNRPTDWANYLRAGNLYLLSLNDDLRITTGRFKTVEAAKAQLPQLKALGFKDAFVKMVNTLAVHKVTDFDTRGVAPAAVVIEEEAPLAVETVPAAATPKEEMEEEVKEEVEELVSKGGEVPKEFDTVAFKKSKPAIDFSLPNIRGKMKRVSVINLQRVLEKEKTYQGAIDGYYGNGTKQGFEQAIKNNRQIKKYQLLADNLAPAPTKAETNQLQYAINMLLDQPLKAMDLLKANRAPIAKAYLAYATFRQNGKQKEVDQLMNSAIAAAFKNKKKGTATPFDYQATYAYHDADQLILHLSYIYAVSSEKTAVPCWLFQEHPSETSKAFEERMGGNYSVEACERFDAWNDIKLLQTIATDINPEPVGQKKLIAAMSNLSRLATATTPLSATMQKDLEKWQVNLWNGLDSWAGKDDLNTQTIGAMKLVYFQSQIRLEDFYMNKGFKKAEAKALALASLKSLIDHQLQRYY